LESRFVCGLAALLSSGVHNCDLREKAIATPSHRFDKTRSLRGIAEGFSNLVDSFVQPLIEIDKRVSRPEFFLQFFPRYDLAAVFEQYRQDLKGLLLKPNLQAVLAQFARTEIHFKDPKPEALGRMFGSLH